MNLPLLILSHVWVFLWHLFCDFRGKLQSWCSSTDRFKIKMEFWKFLSCCSASAGAGEATEATALLQLLAPVLGEEQKLRDCWWDVARGQNLGLGSWSKTGLISTNFTRLKAVSVSELAWRHWNSDSPLWARVQLAQGSITMYLGYILDYLNFPCLGKHSGRMFSYSQNTRAYSWQIESFWNKKMRFLNRMLNLCVAWF